VTAFGGRLLAGRGRVVGLFLQRRLSQVAKLNQTNRNDGGQRRQALQRFRTLELRGFDPTARFQRPVPFFNTTSSVRPFPVGWTAISVLGGAAAGLGFAEMALWC